MATRRTTTKKTTAKATTPEPEQAKGEESSDQAELPTTKASTPAPPQAKEPEPAKAKEPEPKEQPKPKPKKGANVADKKWEVTGSYQGQEYTLKQENAILINHKGDGSLLKIKDYTGKQITVPTSQYGRKGKYDQALPDVVVIADARNFPNWERIKYFRKYDGHKPEPGTGYKVLPFFPKPSKSK